VSVQPGWNFFSLPVIPTDGSIASVFAGHLADLDQLSRYDSATSTFEHFVGDARFDDFSTLEYGTGYQLYATAAFAITLTGTAPRAGWTKSLAAGWHLLGATQAQGSQSTSAWLTGLSGATAYPVGSATSTTTVEVGKSYWVTVPAAGTWTPPGGTEGVTTFTYDGDRGRVKQTTSTGTTIYLGEVYEKTSSTTTKYVFAGSQRIAAVSCGLEPGACSLSFYHTDHLGSSDVVTDGTGTLIEHTEHTPYGAISRHEGTKDFPHKFTGQRQDTANGLILFPARAYDPSLGRFLQPDPYVQDPADPQTLNRYSYVRNNPINFVDPLGLDIFDAAAVVIYQVLPALGKAEGQALSLISLC